MRMFPRHRHHKVLPTSFLSVVYYVPSSPGTKVPFHSVCVGVGMGNPKRVSTLEPPRRDSPKVFCLRIINVVWVTKRGEEEPLLYYVHTCESHVLTWSVGRRVLRTDIDPTPSPGRLSGHRVSSFLLRVKGRTTLSGTRFLWNSYVHLL